MASDSSLLHFLMLPLRLLFWLIELPDTVRSLGLRRTVWRQARARAPEVMAQCTRPRTIEPAELKALKLPNRGFASRPLPAGWRFTLGTVVASVALEVALEDHYGHSVAGHRYQGVLGYFDERQTLRLVRMPLDYNTTEYSFGRSDEQHFRVGRHFVVAFDPRGRGVRLFAQLRPLAVDPRRR